MDDIVPGNLFYLTQAYEAYMYKKHPSMKVSLVNRIARLEEIIDWASEKGEKIKEARLKSGKWGGLPLEDSKYVFSIYYPDITGRNNQKGVVERAVLFSKDPQSQEPFFVKLPDWFYREISKKIVTFQIQD